MYFFELLILKYIYYIKFYYYMRASKHDIKVRNIIFSKITSENSCLSQLNRDDVVLKGLAPE